MRGALHFVGFKDDRVFSALRIFGRPDFYHRIYDKRAVVEIREGDQVVFANGDETQPIREFTHDDSQMFCGDMTTVLKAIVGSRAHGLNRPDSDWDWRGIYVQPTCEILSLGHKDRSIQWIEGKEDFTNYEIGHFLMLATKANPSVLELLRSPTTELPEIAGRQWGKEIQDLLPYLFEPQAAFNAFTGYSLNQRKKLLDDKDGRKWKYALAYVRTLYSLIDLLGTGDFSLQIGDRQRRTLLENIRDGNMSAGEVVDLANGLTLSAKQLLPSAVNRQDLARVNNFLLDVRRCFWGTRHE